MSHISKNPCPSTISHSTTSDFRYHLLLDVAMLPNKSRLARIRERLAFSKDGPPPPPPILPESRPRPLTASCPKRTGYQTSPLFTRLPADILTAILREAFADNVLHIDLDFEHPYRKPKDPTKTHAGRKGRSYTLDRPRAAAGVRREYVPVDKLRSKRWQWWSCVCHRRVRTPWVVIKGTHTTDPVWPKDEVWYDRCRYGENRYCEMISGTAPGKCMVGVMGWLLSCHAA